MVKSILYLLIFIILSVSVSLSQTYYSSVAEIERDIQAEQFKRLKTDYKSDTNVNVTYYKLYLNVTYNPDYLNGEVSIISKSRVNNLSGIFYDLSNNLTIDSVISGNQRLMFSHLMDRVNISLASTVNSGDDITLIIYYRGVPVPTGFGSFIFGSHNNEPSIWNLSEPFGSSDWFPCKNVPSDKADSSDMWLRCADGLTAVSNGTLTGVENNSDGTHTFKWHNSYPIANYLISLAISNYAQYNSFFRYSLNDSMPVVNYIYPENLESLKPQLDKTISMLGLFSAKYGLYPFINEKYGHAEFGRNAGMEHQTISSMGAFFDNILAHELTHQWFGDMITCRNWENIWLNEGFATYGEALYQENTFGRTAYDEFIKFRFSDSKRAIGSVYVQDVNSVEQIFSSDRSYAKGCSVLHMLRGITGDSVFFSIIRKYAAYTSIAYKTAVTEDFQNVAENVYGSDLNYFFNEWIYGENYPKYNVSWEVANTGTSQYRASVKILQDVNSNPSFFSMPMKIKITTLVGDTVFSVFNNMQLQTFDFDLSSRPLNFKIDPYNFILKDVRGENILPVNFILYQNYPNPFNPSTTISYQLGRPSFVKIRIYDLLGKEISVLVNQKQREGDHRADFIPAGLSSGIYFYSIEAKDPEETNLLFSKSGKMLYVK
ncbi:MAG: T9SS type A sorting domain-containing protein [Bacteroidetes bacterium]|nr:T9SS type A sorting domain-containing protein [Bacteroidota bacterium]